MDDISEEVTPSEMKPIQIQEFGKTIKDEDDTIFEVFIKKGSDNDQEDDMFLFGVGGPA
jgi:trans-2-enoyl-CoA reductase